MKVTTIRVRQGDPPSGWTTLAHKPREGGMGTFAMERVCPWRPRPRSVSESLGAPLGLARPPPPPRVLDQRASEIVAGCVFSEWHSPAKTAPPSATIDEKQIAPVEVDDGTVKTVWPEALVFWVEPGRAQRQAATKSASCVPLLAWVGPQTYPPTRTCRRRGEAIGIGSIRPGLPDPAPESGFRSRTPGRRRAASIFW
jgi:hypothetical protein